MTLGRRLAAILVLALGATSSFAQAELQRPTARATRCQTPPEIDGHLDDQVWEAADPFGDFLLVNPVEGEPQSQETEVRVLFDPDYLYFGLRYHDREPERIISTTRERDGFLSDSDYSEILIDPFLDRRNAFFFQFNPTGS